jgi:hypothetical protein
LDALAKASSAGELVAAHRTVTRETLARRKAAQRALGPLAETFKAAMEVSEKMRAEGVPRSDREAYVANVLREAWPKGRPEPWHYHCEDCSDTGWASRTCQHRSCGRPFKLPGQAGDDRTGQGTCTPGHSYVEPCRCVKGEERRRQLLKQRRPEDVVDMAARGLKFTKVGR